MKINRRVKRFHDAFGYFYEGGICQQQWLVGMEDTRVSNGTIDRLDKSKSREGSDRFVKGPRSIEKTRK